MRPAFVFAVASGVLYFLAFPGVGLWPLGFVALVPLIVALRCRTPSRAAAIGWVAGFTMNVLGLHWVVGALQAHGELDLVASVATELALSALQGGRFALLGWLVARGTARGWPFDAVFLLAFGACELLWPVVFPWSYGAVLHDFPVLLQAAELFGPTGVALLLVSPNLALSEPIRARQEGRRVDRARLFALGAVLPIASVAGALRVHVIDLRVAAAPAASVALVQANHPAGAAASAWQEQLELAGPVAASAGPDLIVFSEALPGQRLDAAAVPAAVAHTLRQTHGVPALLGVQLAEGPRLFNSAILADGKAGGARYDKRRLLPFAEELPFAGVFPALRSALPRAGAFTPGEIAAPMPLGSRGLSVFICYEDVFPGLVRELVRAGVSDLLVNLTNDAWFGDTVEPTIHFALSKFRAIEHRRFFVRATNTGISAVVDPSGRVVAEAARFTRATLVQPVKWLRGQTAFELWGEAPLAVLSAISFLAAFVRRRERAPDPSRSVSSHS